MVPVNAFFGTKEMDGSSDAAGGCGVNSPKEIIFPTKGPSSLIDSLSSMNEFKW